MSIEKNILVYASHYEHINRGCMEALLQKFPNFSLRLILVRCNDSHNVCYLNQCLASADKHFCCNYTAACSVCVANQSVFEHYASQLRIPISTIHVPEASCSDVVSSELAGLIKYCLPIISDPNLASRLNDHAGFLGVCCQYCDSAATFVALLRGVLGELASIRKDTSYLENCLELITLKLLSLFPVYRYLDSTLDFESIDHAFIFNGRFLLGKILSIFCDKHSISWSCYEGSFEWGPAATRYNFVEQGSLQNFRARASTLHGYAALHRSDDVDASAVLHGCRSLKDRVLRKKQSAGYRLFVNHQFASKHVGSTFVLFLTTSLFEFFLTDDFLDDAGSDQLAMLRQVIHCLPPTQTIVIREHPNSSGADAQFKQRMRQLVSTLLPSQRYQFIPSEEQADTYLLMREASVVVGASSMALVEALFLSVPMYFLSPAIYSNYLPHRYCEWSDPNSLRQCLAQPRLPSLEEIRAVSRYFTDYNALFGGRPSVVPTMRDLIPSREVLRSCRHYDHLLI
jgi:hypothetical protein